MGLLYEAQAKGVPASRRAGRAARRRPIRWPSMLVEGVAGRREEIDGLLAAPRPRLDARAHARARPHGHGDRHVRAAGHGPTCPRRSCIDEAVELAKRFGTDDSGRFVNGVLSAIAKKVRAGADAEPESPPPTAGYSRRRARPCGSSKG